MKSRHRIDQEVGTFDVPELADIDDIGGIGRPGDGIEFVSGYAVEHAAHELRRNSDRALVGIARKGTLEQEQVRGVHQRAFKSAVEEAL